MEENVLSVFKEGVVAISEGIRSLAPQVWDIMVKQQIINGYTNFLWALFALSIVIVSIWIIKNLSKKLRETTDDGEEWVVYIVGSFVVVILSFVCVDTITTGIKMLFNPEYYALMDLKSIVLP